MTLALAAGTLFVGGDGRDSVVGGRDRLFLFLDWQYLSIVVDYGSVAGFFFFCLSERETILQTKTKSN